MPTIVDRLFKTASSADLYDVIAAALNALAERGEELAFGPVGIDTDHADISPDEDDGNRFVVAYYGNSNAETAALPPTPIQGGA